MKDSTARRILPGWLWRYVYSFEAMIEDAVDELERTLQPQTRVLDAGAGEARFAARFQSQRYVAVDLGVGDAAWDYSRLSAVADLGALPFSGGCFDAALSIVTLEHLRDPGAALRETARVMKTGATLLVVVPQEWEVHQAPHDYFRFTRHGLRHLLEEAGLVVVQLEPAGGLFRVLARRLLNASRLFPPFGLIGVPLALAAPLFDFLDRRQDFTLGYRCIARKA